MNLPNKLTVLRIFLVPIVWLVWLFPYQEFGIVFGCLQLEHISVSYLNIIVLLLFGIASITDFLDGHIARSKKLITTFGKFADPIADKLLVNSMFIILAYKGMVPVLPVLIMLSRDTIVDGCRMIASSNGVVVAAGVLGKLKTVLQMFSIIFVLLCNLPFELYGLPIADLMVWFASFVSIVSGVTYFTKLREYIFESM